MPNDCWTRSNPVRPRQHRTLNALLERGRRGCQDPVGLNGVPGDFNRCVVELGKYVSPGIVKGLCSNLHQRATGARPGHAATEQHH